MSFIDLHCHSTASDGTLPPREVLRLANNRGLTALALTDHDTIGGIADAADEAAKLGIDFLPGIEISCEYAPGTMHILGYGVDPKSAVLTDMTEKLIEGRDNRNPKIIAKLQELGVAITMDEVEKQAAGGLPASAGNTKSVIGRPHIAAILVRKGYVSSIKQAFNEYLAPGGKAYFDKERLSSKQALGMILDSGGLPVLAHAFQLRCDNDSQLETVVKNLLDQGLAGIEVLHSDHDAAWVDKCNRLADRYQLLKTGGSDFHGGNKHNIDLGLAAGRHIPRAFYDALVARLQSGRKAG
ncbi:PHP domain-containing protein [soil metagenome]